MSHDDDLHPFELKVWLYFPTLIYNLITEVNRNEGWKKAYEKPIVKFLNEVEEKDTESISDLSRELEKDLIAVHLTEETFKLALLSTTKQLHELQNESRSIKDFFNVRFTKIGESVTGFDFEKSKERLLNQIDKNPPILFHDIIEDLTNTPKEIDRYHPRTKEQVKTLVEKTRRSIDLPIIVSFRKYLPKNSLDDFEDFFMVAKVESSTNLAKADLSDLRAIIENNESFKSTWKVTLEKFLQSQIHNKEKELEDFNEKLTIFSSLLDDYLDDYQDYIEGDKTLEALCKEGLIPEIYLTDLERLQELREYFSFNFDRDSIEDLNSKVIPLCEELETLRNVKEKGFIESFNYVMSEIQDSIRNPSELPIELYNRNQRLRGYEKTQRPQGFLQRKRLDEHGLDTLPSRLETMNRNLREVQSSINTKGEEIIKTVKATEERVIAENQNLMDVHELLNLITLEKKTPEKIIEKVLRNMKYEYTPEKIEEWLRKLKAALLKDMLYKKMFKKSTKEKLFLFFKDVAKVILGKIGEKVLDEIAKLFEQKN